MHRIAGDHKNSPYVAMPDIDHIEDDVLPPTPISYPLSPMTGTGSSSRRNWLIYSS